MGNLNTTVSNRCYFPTYLSNLMLKLAIVATTAIVSLLATNGIADAKERSIHKQSTPHSDRQQQLHFSAKQPKFTIPQADLQGIHQAISDYYRTKNQVLISKPAKSGSTSFFDVKSLTLVSFSNTEAEVLTEVTQQHYNLTNTSIKKLDARGDVKEKIGFKFEKVDGKWQIQDRK
jgi:hypothetical protein